MGARICIDLNVVTKACSILLVAAEAYADAKAQRNAIEARCREEGIKFIPVVAETYGGWSSEARRVLAAIGKARAEKRGMTESASTARLFQQLSVAIQTANAKHILARSKAMEGNPRREAAQTALRAPAVLAIEALAD